MPSTDVNSPVSPAPIDRLALGVGPVRPGVGSIGGTANPSSQCTFSVLYGNCFAGNEE
ncbi:unannotated protein [freshwater metagenome]|uniref:Unannotated protein n=1 Tax=freshwater metagenome TaxID=449393 RepID=A0A6J7P5X7_9ZZZZ|nr:hypothetical protein [Actinomycetota bacterium]MSW10968.1 hypothetical protein [Actinomycetota bacterium]MSY16934.1 hypothetical protein [Actinomycetota bacterium]MSY40685.1 hypothetical protein [Actinomycetota bacterium]